MPPHWSAQLDTEQPLIANNSSGGGLAEIETIRTLSYKGRLSWEGAGSSEGADLPAR